MNNNNNDLPESEVQDQQVPGYEDGRIEPTLNTDVDADVDVDVDSALRNDLAQDDLDEEVQERMSDEDTRVLAESAKRAINTGQIRVIMICVGVGLLILGLVVKALLSEEEEVVVLGEVAVPKTSTQASAIVTPEQAAYIKAKQEKEGIAAEQKGETYIAEFVTERPVEDPYLEGGAEPTLGVSAKIERKRYMDGKGGSYSAEQAAQLAAEGKVIEGVTTGAGSIADPNAGLATPSGSGSANPGAQSGAAGTASGSNQNKAPAAPAYVPYEITQYTPTAKTSEGAESVNAGTTALDKAAKDTEEWQAQYLEMRRKKAELYDQKAQSSFEIQVKRLEETIKASSVNVHTMRYSSVAYPGLPKEPEAEDGAANPAPGPAPEAEVKPTIYAGETFRAILKNEVNTDNGNEVIAQLVQGPYKGATIIGTVSKTNDNIQFNFKRLLRKGKEEVAISAIARQIGTNSAGMADSINRHYLKRYSALILSSGLSGVGEAYEQTAGVNAKVEGQTVVAETSEPSSKRILGNAIGELGDEISGEIKKHQATPTTYITKSGKVFNVFFTQSVVEQPKKNNK